MLFVWINGHGYTNSFNDIIKPMPIKDYGVVFDCGSSGTRVFVYTWPRNGFSQESVVFKTASSVDFSEILFSRPSADSNRLLDISPLTDERGEPVQLKVEPGLSSFGRFLRSVSFVHYFSADDVSGLEGHIAPLISIGKCCRFVDTQAKLDFG